jgi:hypothetical protein
LPTLLPQTLRNCHYCHFCLILYIFIAIKLN